jgi:ParB family transcriptional regulator, chromosome partitioning protein
MTDWFTPSAGNFFNRVSRAAILASVEEAKGGYGPALERMKKAELATRAADMIAGTGWLPAPLRITETDDDAADASGALAEAAE